MKKESFTSFMKQVAADLQQSGNLGTAHVYRSSLNAILVFQESESVEFREIILRVAFVPAGVVGTRCLRTFARCVPFTIGPSIFIVRRTCRICSVPYIQVRGRTAGGRWIWKT